MTSEVGEIPEFRKIPEKSHACVLYGLVPIALYKFDPKDMIYATFEEQMSEDVFAQKRETQILKSPIILVHQCANL